MNIDTFFQEETFWCFVLPSLKERDGRFTWYLGSSALVISLVHATLRQFYLHQAAVVLCSTPLQRIARNKNLHKANRSHHVSSPVLSETKPTSDTQKSTAGKEKRKMARAKSRYLWDIFSFSGRLLDL